MHTHTCRVYSCVHIRVCVYVCMFIYLCMCRCVHVCGWVQMYMCMHVCKNQKLSMDFVLPAPFTFSFWDSFFHHLGVHLDGVGWSLSSGIRLSLDPQHWDHNHALTYGFLGGFQGKTKVFMFVRQVVYQPPSCVHLNVYFCHKILTVF